MQRYIVVKVAGKDPPKVPAFLTQDRPKVYVFRKGKSAGDAKR